MFSDSPNDNQLSNVNTTSWCNWVSSWCHSNHFPILISNYYSDSALNSHQRIAILNKQIDDLRKTYNMIKTELASIDRRRKKLRRRERENKKQQQIKMQQSTS